VCKVETDPGELGFDAARLARIDSHFARYVDDGRLAGWSVAVSRRGELAHVAHHGLRDLAGGLPVDDDTIWRIYSMTKPVTSVAALMLWEEGLLELTDPVSRYLPSFADQRVYTGGSAANPGTVPATEPVRLWHLLTHTAGLTYGFHHAHPVDEMYRAKGHEFSPPRGQDLAAACDVWASLPLLFQPGTEWNYGVNTDVLGRVVEVVSGQTLAEFFRDRIFTPLGMHDTGFQVHDTANLATLYVPRPGGGLVESKRMGAAITEEPVCLSGGGGLASTLYDYHRFTQMLRGGGELDGMRLLGPRTLAYATRNHLPGGRDLEEIGRPIFAESPYKGTGFGLGFSVVVDPAAGKQLQGLGEYGWGGLASTAFYLDPVEDVTVVFMTQLMPSSTHPIRPQLRVLVSQAVVS
jgi:CubicO group peptidase (beta-lactamase class C family)